MVSHLVLLAAVLLNPVAACTTLVAATGATDDGSVMAAHSNDGDGTTIANLKRVNAAKWQLPQDRHVSGGSVPQVDNTYAFFTKIGGYASFNQFQVGLAESTCNAIFGGKRSAAVLNIVDLSELGLERANTSRAAARIMGHLAETHGYYDAGESLLVTDPREAWIFHVLPDDTGASAIWVAQRVPEDHVGVVANAFTVRVVDLNSSDTFLYSTSMLDVALRTNRWKPGTPFDFTRIYSGPEMGHKYASGRRMWGAYRLLASPEAFGNLSPKYQEIVSDAPYPATLPGRNVSLTRMLRTMRDYYQDTAFDMRRGLAAGPFGSPDRRLPGAAEQHVIGAWERTISLQRTIVSYVVVSRAWLPAEVGGVLWYAPHAAHTTVYVPFAAAMLSPDAADVQLPESHTNNSGKLNRGISAHQAARFVFDAAQTRFDLAIPEIQAQQQLWEDRGAELQERSAADFIAGSANVSSLARRFSSHATAAVSAWWELSDQLLESCGAAGEKHGYPEWWLQAVNYSAGPGPAEPVPPLTEPVLVSLV